MEKILPLFQLIHKTIQVASSSVEWGERLRNILNLVYREFRADRATLLMLNPDNRILIPRYSLPARILEADRGLSLEKGIIGPFAQRREALILERLKKKEFRSISRHPLFKGLASLAAIPIHDDNFLYGLLTLGFKEEKHFTDTEGVVLSALAREIASSIRFHRTQLDSKKRIAELSVFYEVGQAIGATIDLEALLEKIVIICAKVIQGQGCGMVIVDKTTGEIRKDARFGQVPETCSEAQIEACLKDQTQAVYCNGHPLTRRVIMGREELCQKFKKAGCSSLICTPISFKSPFIGKLCVYDKVPAENGQPKGFDQEDMALLSTLASIISNALENALSYQEIERLAEKNERLVEDLSLLFDINRAFMATTNLDQIIHIILRGATASQALGFDRAILFLVDEENQSLLGMDGMMRDEEKIGAAESAPPLSLEEFLLNPPLPRAKETEPTLKLIRSLNIPLKAEAGILARTVLEKQLFYIQDAELDPRVNHRIAAQLSVKQFSTVPLMARGKVVGVLAVDNYTTKRPISPEKARILSMMAQVAGLAIENSRLVHDIEDSNRQLMETRERLIEADKLAALGEMAAGLAHEIRNPLVSIGGFARRLYRKIPPDSEFMTYVQVVIDEVARLEKTLNEILDFSQDTRGQFHEADLGEILEGALGLIKRELDDSRIEVVRDFKEAPPVYCDDRQMKQVFYNLILNAKQAMSRGGPLTLKTYTLKEGPQTLAAAEVRDSGGGIPIDQIHNIFNPFFTTKAAGSGLGLAIVHKIVTRHSGEIDVDNQPGRGVAFIVKLPPASLVKKQIQATRKGKENHETHPGRG
jgi:signal transduction histidine kinase